ncbi:fibronectin type III domain-containing protein [Leifsonia poae]|uniref:fibronectin type III domain-containing protein n=1 Tax=Leifsonia poae TaxID=110933 RepID=UPI003D675AC9
MTVVANNAIGYGEGASTLVFPSREPDAPTNVTVRLGDGSLDVYWDQPEFDGGSQVTSYTVTAQPGGKTKTIAADYWSQNALTFDGLDNGTDYSISVHATNANGDGAESDPIQPRAPSAEEADQDGDGLPDILEERAGTEKTVADTDHDGLSDAIEVLQFTAKLSPTSFDSDGDGIGDADGDVDSDGISNSNELAGGTAPNNPDMDGDGVLDGQEIEHGTDPSKGDSDADGLSDGLEQKLSLNPLSGDSNADGVPDAEAPAQLPMEAVGATATISSLAAVTAEFSLESTEDVRIPGVLSRTATIVPPADFDNSSPSAVAALKLETTSAEVSAATPLQVLAYDTERNVWDAAANPAVYSAVDSTISIQSPSLGVRYAVVDLDEWKRHARVCDSASSGNAPLNVSIIMDETPSVQAADVTGERFNALHTVIDSLQRGDAITVNDFRIVIADFAPGWAALPLVSDPVETGDSSHVGSKAQANAFVDEMAARAASEWGIGGDPFMATLASNFEASASGAALAANGFRDLASSGKATANPYQLGQNPNPAVTCRIDTTVIVTDGAEQPVSYDGVWEGPGEAPAHLPFVDRSDRPVHVLAVGSQNANGGGWLQEVADQTGGTFTYVPSMSVIAFNRQIPHGQIDEAQKLRDDDHDGLSNWIELHGITPASLKGPLGLGVNDVFYSDPENADTDGDGMDDSQEVGEPLTSAQLGGGLRETRSPSTTSSPIPHARTVTAMASVTPRKSNPISIRSMPIWTRTDSTTPPNATGEPSRCWRTPTAMASVTGSR